MYLTNEPSGGAVTSSSHCTDRSTAIILPTEYSPRQPHRFCAQVAKVWYLIPTSSAIFTTVKKFVALLRLLTAQLYVYWIPV